MARCTQFWPSRSSVERIAAYTALLCAIIALAMWLSLESAPRIPLYKGHSYYYWRNLIVTSGSTGIRHAPAFVFLDGGQGIDPESMPLMIKLLSDDASLAREAALLCMWHFGIAAKDAVPGILNIIATSDEPQEVALAFEALTWIGDRSPSVLKNIDTIFHKCNNPEVRLECAFALWHLSTKPNPELEAWLTKVACAELNYDVISRARAVINLRQPRAQSLSTFKSFVRLVREKKDEGCRLEIVDFLGKCTCPLEVAEAITVLTELMKEDDLEIKFKSALAVAKLSRNSDLATKAISEVLDHANDHLKVPAIEWFSENRDPGNLVLNKLQSICDNLSYSQSLSSSFALSQAVF